MPGLAAERLCLSGAETLGASLPTHPHPHTFLTLLQRVPQFLGAVLGNATVIWEEIVSSFKVIINYLQVFVSWNHVACYCSTPVHAYLGLSLVDNSGTF